MKKTILLGIIFLFLLSSFVSAELTEDLVSYWKLDEISGTNADDAHGTNDGTANNARVFTSEISGILNTGADFTQGTDWIETVEDFDFVQNTGDFSIGLWVKLSSVTSDRLEVFLSTDKLTTANKGFSLFYENRASQGSPKALKFIAKRGVSGSTAFVIEYTNAITDTNWHHIVITGNSPTEDIKMYIDGTEITPTTQSWDVLSTGASTHNFHIGTTGGQTNPTTSLIDEVGIWSRALSSDEVSELYNSGNALSYDDFSTETTPSTTTLSVQDIDTFSATFRSLPLSNDFTGDLFIQYQYVLAEDVDITEAQEFWDWSSIPTTVGVYSDGLEAFDNTIDTTDTSIFTTLRPNSLYYVRANVLWDDGIFYGESVNFTTLLPEFPVLETETALQIGNESMVARGKLVSLGDFDSIDVAIFFDSSELYSATMTVPDTVGQTAFFLDENTTYCYYFIGTVSWTDDNGFNAQSQQGDTLCYTTVFGGDPIINTLPASNIKREEANIRGEIFSLEIHDELPFYFKYWNDGNESEALYTDTIPYTLDGIEVTENIEGLFMNTTYYFEWIANISGREVSGGVLSFTTLSILDFLSPTISLSVADVDYEDITINVDAELNDVNISTLYFYLYDRNQDFLELKTLVINETGFHSMNFDGLQSQELYYYDVALRYYDPDEEIFLNITTELGASTTLDVYETPTTVCVIDRFCLPISDRYLFMMLFIVGISIMGIGFAVGNNLSNGNGAEKLLMTGVTGLTIVGSIWMYSVDIMPGWIFIYIILGNVLIGIYYLLQSVNGGSVYG